MCHHLSFIVTVFFIILLSSTKFHSAPSPVSNYFDLLLPQLSLVCKMLYQCHSSSPHLNHPFFTFNHPLSSFFLVYFSPGTFNLLPISSTFNVCACTLNIRSLLNPLKYTEISDLAETRNIDFVCSNWNLDYSFCYIYLSIELRKTTPPGFFLISNSRTASTTHAHVVGGSTVHCFSFAWFSLVRCHCQVTSMSCLQPFWTVICHPQTSPF